MAHSKRINHVGMVVPNIDKFLETSQVLFGGFTKSEVILNERQRVRELFLDDGHTRIELLEPTGPDSPVAGLLQRNRGAVLAHLAIDVPNLADAINEVEASGGFVVVEPVPDVAFQEREIAFVVLGGQMIELIQAPP